MLRSNSIKFDPPKFTGNVMENNINHSTDDENKRGENKTDAPDIKPSEIENGDEENAPGRTAGKAEGSREIVEEDLEAV